MRASKERMPVPSPSLPAGPMDDLSHRLANALVGNDDKAAALEITLTGPTLKFHTDSMVALCGAEADMFGECQLGPGHRQHGF